MALREQLRGEATAPWGSGPVPSLIDGEWVVPEGGRLLAVENPATGRRLAELSYGGTAEALAAADSAEAALDGWAGRPARERSDLLRNAADLVDDRSAAIGELLAADAGKRLSEAVGEAHFSAEFLRWFAEAVRQPAGSVLRSEQAERHQVTFSRPAGVVACLTPWNFPMSILARKVAPALAAGCTVVARPSERAPLAAVELARALVDAGLPKGVFNLVHGPAAEQSEAILAHPSVRVVSFTGSTDVGKHIMTLAARRAVRCVLELGGDAPFIVFADADLDAAVTGLMIAKFRNNGQSCIAANRVFVERSVFDAFTERLGNAVAAMSIGDPLGNGDVDLGPLISAERVREVKALVEEGRAGGGSVLTSSGQIPEAGHWCPPSFVIEPPAGSGLVTSEVFGPAAGVSAFDSEDEVVVRANDTELGLAGFVYTRDVGRAWRMGERLEVGILGCNDPVPPVAFATLGGVKQSGIGREGGATGLEEFEEWHYMSFGQ